MHESKREATTLEVPAEKRTLIVKAGEAFQVPSGGLVKLVEVLKGHGQRVVIEVTVPTHPAETRAFIIPTAETSRVPSSDSADSQAQT